MLASHAKRSLEGSNGIINSCVDDLGVPRTRTRPRPFLGIEQEHLSTGALKLARDCQPNDTRTDDRAVYFYRVTHACSQMSKGFQSSQTHRNRVSPTQVLAESISFNVKSLSPNALKITLHPLHLDNPHAG